MKNRIRLLATLLLLLIITGAFSFKDSQNANIAFKDDTDTIAHPSYPSAVVIELYTSEGCSGCPQAEEVQTQLQNYYNKQNRPVYLLGFHVDYWDHMGWKDNYAQNAFTERQQLYKKLFRLQSIYTPQAVVNGRSEVNASDDYTLQKYISDELGEKSYHSLSCSIKDTSGSSITVEYELEGPVKDLLLNIAIVDKKTSASILKGENANLKITHINTVVFFETNYIETSKGTITNKLPIHYNPKKQDAVVYLQNLKTLQICGAQRL